MRGWHASERDGASGTSTGALERSSRRVRKYRLQLLRRRRVFSDHPVARYKTPGGSLTFNGFHDGYIAVVCNVDNPRFTGYDRGQPGMEQASGDLPPPRWAW